MATNQTSEAMRSDERSGSHSPGPWTLDEASRISVHGSACVAFVVNETTSIADVCASYNVTDDVAMANARLIAAAPELFEALRALVEATEDTLRSHLRATECCSVTRHRCELARCALAKAEGRS